MKARGWIREVLGAVDRAGVINRCAHRIKWRSRNYLVHHVRNNMLGAQ